MTGEFMNKNDKGFLQGGLDPAVAAAIGRGNDHQAMASLPISERKKKLKAKARQDSRNGRRAVYDMDPDVIKVIAAIAEAKKCSASNVAEMFLRFALRADVDLDQYSEPMQHPKFDCKLVWKE
jgi:hypothetical protein